VRREPRDAQKDTGGSCHLHLLNLEQPRVRTSVTRFHRALPSEGHQRSHGLCEEKPVWMGKHASPRDSARDDPIGIRRKDGCHVVQSEYGLSSLTVRADPAGIIRPLALGKTATTVQEHVPHPLRLTFSIPPRPLSVRWPFLPPATILRSVRCCAFPDILIKFFGNRIPAGHTRTPCSSPTEFGSRPRDRPVLLRSRTCSRHLPHALDDPACQRGCCGSARRAR
jgi:hypothetical protein